MRKSRVAIRALAAIALVGASLTAHAALGSSPLTNADANVRTTQRLAWSGAFTVNVVKLASGSVTEYVSSTENRVFAVDWYGSTQPELKQILGSSYQTYASATPRSPGVTIDGLSSRTVSANGFVVHTRGDQGHVHGNAYIPAAFPQGVTLQSLKQQL